MSGTNTIHLFFLYCIVAYPFLFTTTLSLSLFC